MNPAMQALLSGGLSFGAVLLIAISELRALRKYRGRDDDGPRRSPAPPPKPSPGGSRVLPACLVPNAHWRGPDPSTSPTRVRELA